MCVCEYKCADRSNYGAQPISIGFLKGSGLLGELWLYNYSICVQEEIFVARAPGRLDVMGGIADYSGSLVLQVQFLPSIPCFDF